MIQAFLAYYKHAKTRYRVHSPFVFEWANTVLDDDRYYYAFDRADHLRSLLADDDTSIEVTDLGAGSRTTKKNTRKISQIAKTAVSSVRKCVFLFKTIQLYKPKTMLELGTSLGVSAVYQALAHTDGHLTTLEGCPNIAARATKNLALAQVKNVTVTVGEFQKTLPIYLNSIDRLDYVFIDGHHAYAPTIAYFEQCLAKAHEQSIFVFDDIYWSAEMQQVWREIKQHPKVTLTIDVFEMGIVFFRPEQKQTEHFTLIEAWAKIWERYI